MKLKYFGIRHHGPGCSRSLLLELPRFEPDLILLEAPLDTREVFALLADSDLKPPVAVLGWEQGRPEHFQILPFAGFSPEWLALQWAFSRQVEVRFMDVPMSLSLTESQNLPREDDRLGLLAQAANRPDFETWWDELVESGPVEEDVFSRIESLMDEARGEEGGSAGDRIREAYMRLQIQKALKDGYAKIAVICGAWHVPALKKKVSLKEDRQAIKGLLAVKLNLAWIPWSLPLLAAQNGYRAGVLAPAWYEHLFSGLSASEFIIRAAHLLRPLHEVSVAQCMDAVQMAHALASLRSRSLIGLMEIEDAVLSCLCSGQPRIFAGIKDKWLIGSRIGEIPENAPKTALEHAFEAEVKSLRLKLNPEPKEVILDLREEAHRKKSLFFRRMALLGVEFGETIQSSVRSRGDFREIWRYFWEPTLRLHLIAAQMYGTTIRDAAQNRVISKVSSSEDPKEVAELLERTLYADLEEAVPDILSRLRELSARYMGFVYFMDVIPSLARAIAFGNTHLKNPKPLEDCLGFLLVHLREELVLEARSLHEDLLESYLFGMQAITRSLQNLGDAVFLNFWFETLHKLLGDDAVEAAIQGRALRILLDQGEIGEEFFQISLQRMLGKGSDPYLACSWLQAFLGESVLSVVYSAKILVPMVEWCDGLSEEEFIEFLPLLRRCFMDLPPGERKRILQKILQEEKETSEQLWDLTKAEAMLPAIRHLLGDDVHADG